MPDDDDLRAPHPPASDLRAPHPPASDPQAPHPPAAGLDATDVRATPGTGLAAKLEYLFRAVREPGRREWSNEEVAAAIARDQGVTISASYLWYLRTGQRDNPTLKHLCALARFFGVPAAYFFDDETTRQVQAELGLARAMQHAGVRDVALRADGLSPESLDAIRDMIDRVRQLEGLPPPDDGRRQGRS